MKKLIKKTIAYIIIAFFTFSLIRGIYNGYNYGKAYNEFRKTKVTDSNIDISDIEDGYILLQGKISGDSYIFENKYIKPTSEFIYVEENKQGYSYRSGWSDAGSSNFYANNISFLNVSIDLKNFYVNSDESISSENIKESYAKDYNDAINVSNYSRILYKVIKNNDDVLVYSKVKNGQLVPINDSQNSIMFVGTDSYYKLNAYLESNYKENIWCVVFISLLVVSSATLFFILKKKYKRIV